jgi:hypothetical protein
MTMKGAFLTAVAALLGTAIANGHAKQRRHGHDAFHVRRDLETATPNSATCGCYTTVITYWGSPTCEYFTIIAITDAITMIIITLYTVLRSQASYW